MSRPSCHPVDGRRLRGTRVALPLMALLGAAPGVADEHAARPSADLLHFLARFADEQGALLEPELLDAQLPDAALPDASPLEAADAARQRNAGPRTGSPQPPRRSPRTAADPMPAAPTADPDRKERP